MLLMMKAWSYLTEDPFILWIGYAVRAISQKYVSMWTYAGVGTIFISFVRYAPYDEEAVEWPNLRSIHHVDLICM